MNGCHGGLAFNVGHLASQLEAIAQVRKLEELRLEKDMGFIILLALELADKVGEQNNTLENLACCFAKLGGV